MIWYKFFLADYIKDTHHLEDAEDLAYRRLIDMYYLTEKPIPLDLASVARKVRLDLDVVELVIKEFFDKQDDGYHNSRCDKEISSYQHRSRVNHELIKRRWDKAKNQSNTNGNTNIIPNQISESDKTRKTIVSAEPTWFDEFWSTWPTSKRKVGKAACKKKWIQHRLDSIADQILANVRVMKGTEPWTTGFEPAPLTYLNQKRWEDDAPQLIRRAK